MKFVKGAAAIAFSLGVSGVFADDSYIDIHCGQLLDVEKKQTLSDQHILVKNSVIAEIGATVSTPEGSEKVDLSNQTCMPGLMDMHVHLFIDASKAAPDSSLYFNSSADQTLMGVKNLKTLINQGFTTIRIPGDHDKAYASISLKNAVNRGDITGPRMLVAPHLWSPTGGHGDVNTLAYDSHIKPLMNIVDGVDNIRRAVRTEFKYGADWIKIMVSGGIMSHNDDPNVPAYSDEELKAFVDETHRHNKKITAHGMGDAGVYAAVKAGIDSIEHGSLVSERTLKLMAKKGTYYVPTLYGMEWVLAMGKKGGISANNLAKATKVSEQHFNNAKLAYKHGVKMALGSDPIFPMDQAIREFGAMARRIPDNWYVLQTGTINSAEMLGLDAEIGSLAVGKQADIVATPKSPVDDMRNIEEVSFVMKGGEIIRQD